MNILTLKSSITQAALNRFVETAEEGQELYCERIKGFSLFKNRAAGSASYRYRPTSRHISRTPITIGRTSKLTIKLACQIAVKLIDAINQGDDPKETLRELVQGQLRKTKAKDDDLSVLGNFYREIYKPMRLRESGNSAASALNSIEKQWGHIFDKRMAQIKPLDITRWQDEKERDGLKYNTISKYYNLLRAILSTAMRLSHEAGGQHQGLLLALPFSVRPLRKPSKKQKEQHLEKARDLEIDSRRMLTVEELQAVEKGLMLYGLQVIAQRERSRCHANKLHLPSLKGQVMPHWVIPFTYLAYYTGLRPGDIADLRWEDLIDNKLRKVTNKSKHLAEPVIVNFELSDDKSVLAFSCVEVLDIWRGQQGNPKRGWLFPQIRDNNKPLSEKGYKKSWDNVQKLASIKLDMYSFRHNFISTLIRKGFNLKLVAEMAGHKTTEMIEKHYAHHFPEDKAKAMSVF